MRAGEGWAGRSGGNPAGLFQDAECSEREVQVYAARDGGSRFVTVKRDTTMRVEVWRASGLQQQQQQQPALMRRKADAMLRRQQPFGYVYQVLTLMALVMLLLSSSSPLILTSL